MSRQPIPGMREGESLNEFHDRYIMPPADETARKNAAIDQFVRFLQDSFRRSDYTVAEVHRCGPLGKGTAVRGSADIDLVVFFNGLGEMKKLMQKRRQLLKELKAKVDSYEPWRGRVELRKMLYFLSYNLEGMTLDILPAFDVVKGSQNNLMVVYHTMSQHPGGPTEAGKEYSICLAPLQISFVKQQNEHVKRAIRLIKYWKKANSLVILSYCVELITIHASKKVRQQSADVIFKKVLKLLMGCSSLRIAFDDNYVSANYTRSLKAPYVLDPTNPFRNTLENVGHHEQLKISQAAKEALACL